MWRNQTYRDRNELALVSLQPHSAHDGARVYNEILFLSLRRFDDGLGLHEISEFGNANWRASYASATQLSTQMSFRGAESNC